MCGKYLHTLKPDTVCVWKIPPYLGCCDESYMIKVNILQSNLNSIKYKLNYKPYGPEMK